VRLSEKVCPTFPEIKGQLVVICRGGYTWNGKYSILEQPLASETLIGSVKFPAFGNVPQILALFKVCCEITRSAIGVTISQE